MKINELKLEQKNLDLIIKVEDIGESRQVTTQLDDNFHDVCEVYCGDETASVFLTIWDEKIEEMQKGNYYKISNCYTNEYRGSLRLNIGKFGKIEQTQGDFEINTANNLSLKEIQGNTLL
ncbi:hypothetical protein IIC68_03205 [archaeon]|nr:hypothetical protein [archaeon]